MIYVRLVPHHISTTVNLNIYKGFSNWNNYFINFASCLYVFTMRGERRKSIYICDDVIYIYIYIYMYIARFWNFGSILSQSREDWLVAFKCIFVTNVRHTPEIHLFLSLFLYLSERKILARQCRFQFVCRKKILPCEINPRWKFTLEIWIFRRFLM